MDFPTIPEKARLWTIDIIDSLLHISESESEKLDFKREVTDLTRHICAMANTSGGYIVLGIGEGPNGVFEKRGFANGEQDEIDLKIRGMQFLIEPIPRITTHYVIENNLIYPIIQIHEELSKKAFFLRDKGICYIRIGSSSKPAPRSTIMKLFAGSVEYRKHIENLRSSCILLNEAISSTINYLGRISTQDQTRPAPIDLTLITHAILNTENFLSEHELLGKTSSDSVRPGMTTMLNTLEQLNAQIHAYNTTTDITVKNDIRLMILNTSGRVLAEQLQRIPKFLEQVISKTEEFLSKYD